MAGYLWLPLVPVYKCVCMPGRARPPCRCSYFQDPQQVCQGAVIAYIFKGHHHKCLSQGLCTLGVMVGYSKGLRMRGVIYALALYCFMLCLENSQISGVGIAFDRCLLCLAGLSNGTM